MPVITEGVEFANVAREWRMKWIEDDDKKSLAAVQKVLDAKIAAVKAVAGACVFVVFRGEHVARALPPLSPYSIVSLNLAFARILCSK